MPQPNTIQISAPVDTTDITDPYGTHKSWRGIGGWREVADLTERNAITTERRHQGMSVWVVSENKLYVLKTGLTNSDWVEFTGGTLPSDTPVLEWDGVTPFSTVYAAINGSALTGGVQLYLRGTGHTIDNKGSIYTNMDKISFNSFDTQRIINIAQGATIDKMPRLENRVTLQSQSTAYTCANPATIYLGEECILQSDSLVSGVKFISLSGITASCTIKMFGGKILGADVMNAISSSHLQIEMYSSSYIDPAFLSGNSSLILFYQSNISVPLKSEFVYFTGSVNYIPVNNANELSNATNVLWESAYLWSDFYSKQNVASLQSTLTNYLKGSGHAINNKGSIYNNMDKVSFESWNEQKVIDVAQGATFNASPVLISGTNLRSQSTAAVITNPSKPVKIGIDCILSTDTGARFINLTGSATYSCIVNAGSISGSRVFDLAGTTTLSLALLNKSTLDPLSIYGVAGTTLIISYSPDSIVPLPASFANFAGNISYIPLAVSSQVKGAPIIAANLSALQTFKFVGELVVGQWGVAQDTKRSYILNSIDPAALAHVWLEPDFTNMPTTNQKAAMTNANSPQASNPFLTVADGTNNSTAINNTIGQLAGSDTRIYFDSTVVKPSTTENNIELKTLTGFPTGTTELTLPCYATSANSPLLLSAFQSTNITNNYYGIRAGISVGKIWTSASDLSGTTEILQRIMRKTPCNGTVTITGSGTARTATCTDPVFYLADVNPDKTLSTYLVSPKGVYRITGYTSPTAVTVEVPSGYINESNFTASRIVYVYGYTSGNILTITNQEKTFFSDPNAEFTPATGINWTPADQLVVFLWGQTTIASTNKIDIVINGKTRYSHLEIPELIQIKSAVRSIEPSVAYGSCRRSRPISGTGSYSFDFTVPEDFQKLLSAHLVCYPSAAAAGAGRIISTSVEYNNYYGEAYNLFSASELNVTYNLTNFSDKRFHLPFTNILANIRAGAEGGVTVNHVAANGTINYTALEIIYI